MGEVEPIRIGFIGAGNISRSRHLPGLAQIKEAEVVVVANRSIESSRKVAQKFGIPETSEDWRRVVERKDIDAVFIGTWPYMHREIAVAALKQGKHVFCQARMAMDLSEAEEMAAAAREHPDKVNMICPPPTRMPYESYIKKLVSPAEIGTVTSVELVSLNAVNLDRSRITWRENIESSGRQALALGIYAETLNAWLGTYKNLSARTGIPISTKKGLHGEDSLIRIPQVITVTGELESGALITELHSGLVTDKSTLSDRLTVWGLKGTLRYNFSNQVLEYAGADSTLEPVAVPAQFLHPWTVELDFIEAIKQARQGQTWKVSPDFTEGLLYMKKVEAVYLSVESGRNIDVAGL